MLALNDFAPLMQGQRVRAAEALAACFGAGASLACPGSDEFTFELGQTAQNGQHQAAMRMLEFGQCTAQLSTVALGTGGHLPEHLRAASLRELLDLSGNALAISRNPGIAADHDLHCGTDLRNGKA